MDIYWIRVVSQAGIYAVFALYLFWAIRRGPNVWVPYLGTVIYAVLFEHGNMWRYARTPGGYYYHAASWLWVLGDVPLYIPLAWAFLVATSRGLTDQLHLRAWGRPFCDALLTLLIDLCLDAVAIRLRFWYWRGVGLDEGFFGVPADNFVGWLLVTFTFSLLTRWLWEGRATRAGSLTAKASAQFLALPVVAYALYLVLEALVHGAYVVLHARTLGWQLPILAGLIFLFLAVVLAALRGRPANVHDASPTASFSRWDAPMQHGPRHVFHIFGVLGLLCLPVALRDARLWLLALSVWSVESALAVVAHRRHRRVTSSASPRHHP